jgi:hypothetical protein
LAVAAILIPLSIILSEGFAFRYSPEQRKKFTEVSPRAHYRYVVDRFAELDVRRKPFRENEGPRVLVIGDSFARDFVNILSEAHFMDTNCVRTVYVPAICQPLPPNAMANEHIPPRDRAVCARRESIAKAAGIFAQSDLVCLAADWRTWSAELVGQTVSEIRRHGCQKVVVVGTKRIPTITDRMIMRGQFQPVDVSEVAGAREVNAILERNSHAVSFIDLQRLLQKPNGEVICESNDGVLLSYDGKHLTKAGASYLSEKIEMLELVDRPE